jgi:hypothetical protein
MKTVSCEDRYEDTAARNPASGKFSVVVTPIDKPSIEATHAEKLVPAAGH